MKLAVSDIAWLVLVFALVGGITYASYRATPRTSVIETRNEHLIFSSKGCKIYQLVIKNEWGTYVLFVTTPAIKETPLRQAVYPTCRVTR